MRKKEVNDAKLASDYFGRGEGEREIDEPTPREASGTAVSGKVLPKFGAVFLRELYSTSCEPHDPPVTTNATTLTI